ncbi:hypothetical protein J1605_000664 [Eschrichtius robustus]|uniref:Uncharacterized protein n=1 Tax=Eschrichtius robustus TaxID=9764 RepID=A0AB34GP92_ESCRO|nr:hypothetical protein J1605_000664 [Eschrichtius robustus]
MAPVAALLSTEPSVLTFSRCVLTGTTQMSLSATREARHMGGPSRLFSLPRMRLREANRMLAPVPSFLSTGGPAGAAGPRRWQISEEQEATRERALEGATPPAQLRPAHCCPAPSMACRAQEDMEHGHHGGDRTPPGAQQALTSSNSGSEVGLDLVTEMEPPDPPGYRRDIARLFSLWTAGHRPAFLSVDSGTSPGFSLCGQRDIARLPSVLLHTQAVAFTRHVCEHRKEPESRATASPAESPAPSVSLCHSVPYSSVRWDSRGVCQEGRTLSSGQESWGITRDPLEPRADGLVDLLFKREPGTEETGSCWLDRRPSRADRGLPGGQGPSEDESIYRRGARRWRKLYRANGHLFQAKRFNRGVLRSPEPETALQPPARWPRRPARSEGALAEHLVFLLVLPCVL